MSSALQAQLLEKCGKVPAERVREVLDFAEFLASKSSAHSKGKRHRPNRSLRAYVGGVRHGALAREIDHELYNGAVR
ncbi:MAG TPA: DUF2281 domain-containing protein [Verrucomicrobiae bacterium]|nr:DUF2281 domain-containing protein [Verrucomicrobiae bacterium]